MNRRAVLTDAQYQAAKQLAITTIRRFFPNNSSFPVFVPLQPNVATKMNELRDELKEKLPPPHDAVGEDAKAGEAVPGPKRARSEAHAAAAPVPALPRAAGNAPNFGLDMDAGIDVKEEEKGEHDLEWELRNWFSDASPNLSWHDPKSQPNIVWKTNAKVFPRLSLIARRFLCILPTSAPSERVWSGFGHIITKHSSTIDSTTAAQTMYLRYNHHIVDKVAV